MSSVFLGKMKLILNEQSLKELFKQNIIPYKNISIQIWEHESVKANILDYIDNCSNNIEEIEFKSCQFENNDDVFSVLKNLCKLKCINFVNCSIKTSASSKIKSYSLSTLKSITFDNSHGNLYKLLKNQTSVSKITVISNNKVFPHRDFNDLVQSLPKLKHLVFKGDGTSDYFKGSDFPFKIEILEAESMATCLYDATRRFLISQKESLRELSIKKPPCKINFIIEEMKLNIFICGGIPMIVNGQKQKCDKFSMDQFSIALDMFLNTPRTK